MRRPGSPTPTLGRSDVSSPNVTSIQTWKSAKTERKQPHVHILPDMRGRYKVVGDGQVCLRLPTNFLVPLGEGLRCSKKARVRESWPLLQDQAAWRAESLVTHSLSLAASRKVTVRLINVLLNHWSTHSENIAMSQSPAWPLPGRLSPHLSRDRLSPLPRFPTQS